MKLRLWGILFIALLTAGCSSTANLPSRPQAETAQQGPSLDLVDHYLFGGTPNDAGMWLLPQIEGAVHAELSRKGLNLSPREIYNPDSASLNQAIVRLNIGQGGGGTGSFVSREGLILTNHHVAYDAIAEASQGEQNYLENGFYAKAETEEIPAPQYSVYIPIEQTEVTRQIQSRLPDTLSSRQRSQMEQKIRQQLIQQRKAGNEDLVVEINDFWAGNRQFMAVYKVIRDIRLVYAPPSSIGKYGGDVDNWEWPRHTGDYSFLRAYVGPDGNGRAYNKNNVPYQPARSLAIDAGGVRPNDYAMTLGFPGSTYRYESSYAYEFYYNVRNPILIESFQAILDGYEYAAQQDSATAVEIASDRASIANSLKYFQGIQDGFKKYDIIPKKKEREQAFAKWIQQDSTRTMRYGGVLDQLDQAFNIASETGDLLYASYYALNNSTLLQIGSLYDPYFEYIQHPDSLSFSDTRRDSLLQQHRQLLSSVNPEAQIITLSQMIQTLATLPEEKRPAYFKNLFGDATGEELKQGIDAYVDSTLKSSIAFHPDSATTFLELPVAQARQKPVDPMVKLYREVYNSFVSSRQSYARHMIFLEPARKRYVEGMLKFRSDTTEYADANFTLRLSGGRVLGYSPVDGVYNTPFTTFKGMIAKDTDEEPFDAPQQLEEYYRTHPPDSADIPFATPEGPLVVNLLTTNDITGGNSGSPLLDGDGEIIGIAFDSNYEGVIGDYYFDPELKRTINVDIRYMLFLMQEFTGADRLLNELEIVGTNQH